MAGTAGWNSEDLQTLKFRSVSDAINTGLGF